MLDFNPTLNMDPDPTHTDLAEAIGEALGVTLAKPKGTTRNRKPTTKPGRVKRFKHVKKP